MENFDNFMMHLVKAEYQPNGFSVNFGGGYSFDGVEVVDHEKNKDKNNMAALEDFYLRHLTYKNFEYNSPIYGKVIVRFSEPLSIPEGYESGHGVLKDFNVILKEVFA